jgi:hypothetical protein
MLLLTEVQIILYINGRSHSFQVNDGTGQGDPISSFLFNLVMEIFITKLIYDRQINHFKINGTPIMPEVFADDIHMFLDGNDDLALRRVMRITQQFAELSGLHLSISKMEMMGVNESVGMVGQATRLGLSIITQIKFVGAFVT